MEAQEASEMSTANAILKSRNEPMVIDDGQQISLDHFFIPEHYTNYLDHLLVPHGAIIDRIEKLAYDISRDYLGKTIHLLCVLKGGSTFFMELCASLRRFHNYTRQDNLPFTFDFVKVKSYHGCESTGDVKIDGCDVTKLANRHVLFVEDIIDTGLTMTALMQYMEANVRPASCKVAALVEKRTARSCGFKGDYVGFSIPDKFVVGFALDYNEAFRDLAHIGVINDAGIVKFADHDA